MTPPSIWSWAIFFMAIAGHFANLRQARLRGSFTFLGRVRSPNHNWVEMRFDLPEDEEGKPRWVSPMRDAIENYIVQGGLPPWAEEGYQERLPVVAPEPEGYVPSGLVDCDRPDDDPGLDYEVDEFDLRI